MTELERINADAETLFADLWRQYHQLKGGYVPSSYYGTADDRVNQLREIRRELGHMAVSLRFLEDDVSTAISTLGRLREQAMAQAPICEKCQKRWEWLSLSASWGFAHSCGADATAESSDAEHNG